MDPGVLAFDGVDDNAIAATLGTPLAELPHAGWTLAWLLKRTGTPGAFGDSLGYLMWNVSVNLVGLTITNSLAIEATAASGGPSGTSSVFMTSTTSTYIVVVRRPAGANQDLVYSWMLKADGVWTHEQNTASSWSNQTETAEWLEIGTIASTDAGAMHFGLFGAWDHSLTDAQVEELGEAWSLLNWWYNSGGHPVCLVPGNTESLYDIAGNATNWTLTGATVDPAETLDGFSFLDPLQAEPPVRIGVTVPIQVGRGVPSYQ